MKTQRIKLSLLIIALLLSSCGATRYGPRSFKGGYSDTQINDDLYVITFSSNGFTENSQTYLNCLYRCSEIAVLNKKKYFKVLNESDLSSDMVMGSYGSGYVNASTIKKPKIELRIRLTDEYQESTNLFDAEKFINKNSSQLKPSSKLIEARGANWILIKIEND